MENSALVLDIKLDGGPWEDRQKKEVVDLIRNIRPSWNPDNIIVQNLSGGFINKVLLVSTSTNENDKLVVRVNEDRERVFFVNRNYEFSIMSLMAGKGLIKALYCRFSNGLVYAYVDGRVLSQKDYYNPVIRRLIIQKLFEVHSVKAPIDNVTRPIIYETTKYKMVETVHDLPKIFEDINISKWISKNFESVENLKAEVHFTQSLWNSAFARHPLVFCHQDCWYSNIVYDEKDVWLLDWELAGHSIAPMDIAILLDDCINDTNLDMTLLSDVIEEYCSLHVTQRYPVDKATFMKDTVFASMLFALGNLTWSLYIMNNFPLDKHWINLYYMFITRMSGKYKYYKQLISSQT